MAELRKFLYENFADVAGEGIEMARDAKMEDADISAAILVEYLLGGASVALINQISLTEFLFLAKDSYARMATDVKAFAEDLKAKEEAMTKEPVTDGANVVPFTPKNKTLH